MIPAAKTEKALADFFRRDGWEISTWGDTIASREELCQNFADGVSVEVNLTKLADHLADEVRA